jgi:WD40 repeat protein
MTTRLYLPRTAVLNRLASRLPRTLAVDFSNDGRWLATTGEDALVRIFRVSDGVLMYGLREPYVAYELRFSPNTDQVASLTTSGVRVRALDATEEDMFIDWEKWIGGVGLTGLAYSPGEEFLGLVGNGVVRVVDPISGEGVYSLYDVDGALPWSLAFSPDNAFLAVGWSDGQVRMYWAQDGRLLRAFQAHPASVRRLLFNRAGTLLATLAMKDAPLMGSQPIGACHNETLQARKRVGRGVGIYGQAPGKTCRASCAGSSVANNGRKARV